MIRSFPQNGEDWTEEQFEDFHRGLVLIGVSDTLCALCEACAPNDGDQTKIDLWHELLDSAVYDAEQSSRFADWPEGLAMVKDIARHVGNKEADDNGLTHDWMRQLAFYCFDLHRAAKEHWPEPIWPDDNEAE